MKVAINWDILIYPVFRTRLVAQAWQTSKLRSLLRDHFVSCLGAPSLPRSKIKPKSSTQTLQSSGSGRLMCCNLSEKGTELESCCDCGKIRQSTPHFTHSIYPCLCAWCHGDELTTFAWFTSTIFYHLLPLLGCALWPLWPLWHEETTMDIIQVIGQMGKRHVFLCVLIVFPKL